MADLIDDEALDAMEAFADGTLAASLSPLVAVAYLREAVAALRVERDTERYSVEQIREAFRKHATPDDWGVEFFYEDGLVAALRGEYDLEAPDAR